MTPAVAGKSFARHLFRLIQAKTLDATSLGFDGKVGLVSGLARQLDADQDLRSSDRRMLAPQTDSLNEMPAVAAPRCRGHGYQLHGPVAWARDRLCPTMPLRLLPLICKVADGPQWRGAVSRPRPSNRKCGFPPSDFPTAFISRPMATTVRARVEGPAHPIPPRHPPREPAPSQTLGLCVVVGGENTASDHWHADRRPLMQRQGRCGRSTLGQPRRTRFKRPLSTGCAPSAALRYWWVPASTR